MSSRAESKTASQFVSLTMRLKDKLHPQRIRCSDRIKPTPSHRHKPPDLNLDKATVQNKSVCPLADQQRAVVSSLQYFKALVDRLGVDRPGVDKLVQDQSVVGRLLGGASSGILEAVQTLVQLEPHLHNSRTVSACLTRLYQSVAQLIRWADQVMLQGVAHDNKESTASVTTVIRAVLDGVKDLVRLAVERQEGSVPLSPIQSQSTEGQTVGVDIQETSERMSSCRSHIVPAEEREMVSAPPKPPMPLPLLQVTPPQVLSPPALPPKKRQSSCGPTPCRVAIVAPMRREPEDDQQVQQEDDDCLKRCSSSSADSAADSTNCEDDPDYDFLHTDLSSSETLPLLPSPSCLPPALPEKRHRSSTGTTNSQASSNFEFNSAPHEDNPAHIDDVMLPNNQLSSPLSPSKSPPPLPEKKRHIHQYLQFCSSYSAQSAAMFYQKAPTFSQRHNNGQQELEAADHLTLTHLDSESPPDIDSSPSPKLSPAPALPLKKKQQDSAEDRNQRRESFQSLQQEVEHDRKGREEQEEVLLTNQQEVLNRITMKAEDEEGPDVKAASPEILLVYTTEADCSSEQALFREAFLSTYRSFMSPSDIICKLQHRYRHLSEACKTRSLKAAKNTFQLLVRVVDELCVTELDADLLLRLMDLVFSLLIGGELGPAHLLRSNILSKMDKKWQLIGSPQSLRPLAARGVAARPGTLLDFRSQDLAEQLTLLDSELFYKIELPEVLLWSKEQNEEKTPNLTEFTQHFNNVSFWVRSVIILQDKPQDREKLLLKFLKIMKHLRKLNNFNSYLSILSALDSAPLRRLDWQRNTAEALEEFSSLIDSSSSFRAYRAALAEVEPPCIPYLGLILQDLTFVHLGNPDTLITSQGSKVNFSKRWQQFNILDTLRSYQQVPYFLQPNDDIISFFNDFSDHLAEEALYRHLSEACKTRSLKAAKNTFQLLVRVVDELCVTELDADLLLRLMDLVFSLLIGGELGPAHLLRSNILSKMDKKWQLIGSPQSLRPLAARGVAARPGTLLDFRSQDLAEQLTLLDSELFYKIELPEVLLWSKEQNEEKTPNLTEFTQHFNNVSFWVRSVIILQDKPQDREKLLLKFLKIMKHLRKLNNFNSYLSILSALDSAPLRRLDWQRNTAEALEEFSSLIDSSSSFRAYRAALAEVEPPCIPYLGLILQDLTFVHLGNPDTLITSQGSKVNFSKRWQQFNILDTLRSYQQVPYFLQPNDDIISFFNDFSDHLAEEALWELSLRLRPRNAPRANQR